MIELLRYFGLPVGISSVSGRIDEIIVIVHYLMLVLFLGWGAFFIYSLIKFRASKNKKANYHGVDSHYSSILEGAVAVIEIVILFGFAFPRQTIDLRRCLPFFRTGLISLLSTNPQLLQCLVML